MADTRDYIESHLLSLVSEDKRDIFLKNKDSHIDKVFKTLDFVKNISCYEDLLEYTYGIFTYYFTNPGYMDENNKIELSFDNCDLYNTEYMLVDKKYHNDIASINRNSKILTWDSIHATPLRKAGLSAFIRGKDLEKLKDFIRKDYGDKILMNSCKTFFDPNDSHNFYNILQSIDYQGPLYDAEDDNYRGYYLNPQVMSICIFETVFDIIIVNKRFRDGKEVVQQVNDIMESLELEDLHTVSFMGVNFNDNSLFKIIADFSPSDI